MSFCASYVGLNPFYIMEGILIWDGGDVGGLEKDCLNPFYIMEGILIKVLLFLSRTIFLVLIHSTSWKEF